MTAGSTNRKLDRLIMSGKKDYQRLVNADGITHMARMLSFVAEQNLEVLRVGSTHVSVMSIDGRRFRLYLGNHERARRAGQPVGRDVVYDFWIYVLFAQSAAEKACYIGQTRNVSRRMREHWRRRTGNQGSRSLFDWAEERSLAVNVTLVQAVFGNQQDADCAEAEWFARAAAAGYELPGAEVWGPKARGSRIPTHVWPCAKLQRNGCSLEMVASRMIKIIELPKNSELRDDDVEEPSPRMT
ncbi:GIY-YIG nuclease family protein [Burkholderia sp. AU6039]|uniref:GIY-YIG nuclease family protein n=1 Tax=Burkholderia sp. AU6039 TaxID=2015344 RepID=UPI00211ACD35|nr:GIY-YIG nuclease family protein [Burkholderia sp. AU6039]